MRILPVAVLCCWFGVASGFVGSATHRLRPLVSPSVNSFCNRVGPRPVVGRVPGSRVRSSAVSALRAQLRQDEEPQEADEAFPTVEVDRPSIWPLFMLPVPALSTHDLCGSVFCYIEVQVSAWSDRPAIGAESTCINLPLKCFGAKSLCMILLSKHVPQVVR